MAGGKLADVTGRRLVGAVALIAVRHRATSSSFSVAGPADVGAPSWSAPILAGAGRARRSACTRPSCSRPAAAAGANGGHLRAVAWSARASGCCWPGCAARPGRQLRPRDGRARRRPAVVAALVVFAYPETAHRELEDLNPEDREGRPRLRGRLTSAVDGPRPAASRHGCADAAVGALQVVAPPSIHSWVTGPGIVAVAAVELVGRAERVPGALDEQARHGRARGRCSVRSLSGLPGGCSG